MLATILTIIMQKVPVMASTTIIMQKVPAFNPHLINLKALISSSSKSFAESHTHS